MDNELLQAIGQIIENKLTSERDHTRQMIGDLETRLTARIDRVETKVDQLETKVDQVETRLSARIEQVETKVEQLETKVDQLETRLTERVEQSEERIRVLIETDVTYKLQLVLDGHAELDERICELRDMRDKVDDIQGSVAVLKAFSVKQ